MARREPTVPPVDGPRALMARVWRIAAAPDWSEVSAPSVIGIPRRLPFVRPLRTNPAMARLRDVPPVIRKVGIWGFAYRVWMQIGDDQLFTWASALAYSWLFAIFPFFIFL